MKIGHTHPLRTLESSVSDVRKGITKCRMVTGTYMLQSIISKFSKSPVDAISKYCGIENEDLPHMLLECLALLVPRKQFYPDIKSMVIDIIGEEQWKKNLISTSCRIALCVTHSILRVYQL